MRSKAFFKPLSQRIRSHLAEKSNTRAERRSRERTVRTSGPTDWQGRTAMRISVSSWATRDEDVERSVAAILRAAAG